MRMIASLTLAAVAISTPLSASGSIQIKSYIQTFNPKISDKRADSLAQMIVDVSYRNNLDPTLFAAILRRESSFRSGVENVSYGQLPDGEIREYHDLGLGQINWEIWGEKLSLDRDRLQFDDRYNMSIAAKILTRIRREFMDHEPYTWWSRYHSAYEKKRSKYEELVLETLPVEYKICRLRNPAFNPVLASVLPRAM